MTEEQQKKINAGDLLLHGEILYFVEKVDVGEFIWADDVVYVKCLRSPVEELVGNEQQFDYQIFCQYIKDGILKQIKV